MILLCSIDQTHRRVLHIGQMILVNPEAAWWEVSHGTYDAVQEAGKCWRIGEIKAKKEIKSNQIPLGLQQH